jgi:hypothetical protein
MRTLSEAEKDILVTGGKNISYKLSTMPQALPEDANIHAVNAAADTLFIKTYLIHLANANIKPYQNREILRTIVPELIQTLGGPTNYRFINTRHARLIHADRYYPPSPARHKKKKKSYVVATSV